MATKSKLTINLEYWTLRTFCALVNVLPYRVAMTLAQALAWTAFTILRFKRRRTCARIQQVFPGKSACEVRLIARASLANVFQTGVEMMRAPYLTRDWMDRYVVDGPLYSERLRALVEEGHGVVIMVPHAGNWYMAAWAMAKYGLPLFALAARQRNPKLNAWMTRQYGDIEVLDRDCRQTLVQIKARLQQGRAFAILPDLRVRMPDVEVDFLGGKANVSHAGAMFAVRCGAPIVVAAMGRCEGRHVLTHLATLRPNTAAPDGREEARRLTGEVMRLLDAHIRQHPGDWFWYNKRWILEPVK